MMGNKALAVSAADFVDALAEYDHLPAFSFLGITENRSVLANLPPTDTRTGLRSVATWAEAFATSVRFTFHDGYVDVECCVQVGGRDLWMRYCGSPDEVKAIDFGIDVCHCHHAGVSASRVLKAVAS